MALLEVKGLEAFYGQIKALHGLDFELEEGGITTILGANGAGKTTTLRMLATLLKPTAGSGSVDGYDLATESETVRSRIGFLSRHLSLSRSAIPRRRTPGARTQALSRVRDQIIEP